MADCNKYRDLLSAQLDGTLTPAEAEALEAHLTRCPDCRAWKALYETIWNQARPQPVPESLKENVMAAVAKAPAPRRPVRWPRYLAAACVLVACLAALPLLNGRGPAPSEATQNTAGDTAATPAPYAGARYWEEDSAAPADENPQVAGTPADVTEDTAPKADAAPAATPIPPCTIQITGELPELLSGFTLLDMGDGTFSIEIDDLTAAALIALDYPVVAAESGYTVIYTPAATGADAS